MNRYEIERQLGQSVAVGNAVQVAELTHQRQMLIAQECLATAETYRNTALSIFAREREYKPMPHDLAEVFMGILTVHQARLASTDESGWDVEFAGYFFWIRAVDERRNIGGTKIDQMLPGLTFALRQANPSAA